MQRDFDVIVIGAGHAGCEAAHSAARLGKRVLLATIDLKNIAYLACNPSIGGTAKGHLVCEIDALGGIMGQIADKCALQIRMLNTTKGAAVFALRAQVDNIKYPKTMKKTLEGIKNITIKQCEVTDIITKNKTVTGVKLSTGETHTCTAIVVATGVYLNSELLVGLDRKDTGPSGFANSKSLTNSLISLGLEIRRFKTGTPPRVNSATIDFAKTENQKGDEGIQTFSFLTTKPIKNVIECHLTYTNPKTHKIINDNLHLSAMYGPHAKLREKSIGPRYCPCIDDKVVRFPDRDRHQIFLEPESLTNNETYLQGLSMSLHIDAQHKVVHSIKGLEGAEIMRDAYAIEYNCINSLQLTATLEYKNCKGLFFAGQVNGTSGYEEAAAQGLVAGINAAGIKFAPSRTNSYIGVLVDDLITTGTDEPYRMFTSRAEHRLHLRQDNADLRLTPLGREIGLVCDNRWKVFQNKLKLIETKDPSIKHLLDIEKKYEGYIKRELGKIAEAKRCEATLLPQNIDFQSINGLSMESRDKLSLVRPQNIGQASRIKGVTPADINVLLIWLKKETAKKV
jgi:tRNA uridine 5-carboxymethylaminomethyl modification enzyme